MYNIRNLQIYSSTLWRIEEINEKYLEITQKVSKLEQKQREAFFRLIMQKELVATQEIEGENSFLITLYNSLMRENSLDYMTDMFESDITVDKINILHSKLIESTSADKPSNHRYRDGSVHGDNSRWVGYYQNGKKVVEYWPLHSKEVLKFMEKFVSYANELQTDDIFVQPFIMHGLLAVAQPFGDGNTRTARTLQYGKIWQLTNKLTDCNFKLPILYFSDRYKDYRSDYRRIIKEIAINQDSDSWNKWMQFNTKMVDEKVYKLNNDLTSLLKARF